MKEHDLHPPYVAFKEWHVICDALLSGEQSIILRKGGIAEGRAGFAFQHSAFLLFPTFFHSQYDGVRKDVPTEQRQEADQDRQTVEFHGYCRIEGHAVLTAWEEIERLEPFHIWQPSLLRERFDYGNHSALHLAVVKTYRFVSPLQIPYEKRFGGCRSWVEIPVNELPPADTVLDSNAIATLNNTLASLLTTNPLSNNALG